MSRLPARGRVVVETPSETLAGRSSEAILGPNPFVGLSLRDVGMEIGRGVKMALEGPALTTSSIQYLVQELGRIALGESELEPAQRDRRFTDAEWRSHPFYRRWLQGYLAIERTSGQWVAAHDLSPEAQARLQLAISLFLGALAPSNSPLQPSAIRRFREDRKSVV